MNNKTDEMPQDKRHWDSLYQHSSFGGSPWTEGQPTAQLVEIIQSGLIKKGPALDIGTGSGNNAIYLAKNDFTSYGIDISEHAIGLAKEKAINAGIKCQFTIGDASKLPYDNNMFVFIFDRGCFHSISLQNRKAFIRGIYRVLKPNGKYLLGCMGKISNRKFESQLLLSSEDINNLFLPPFNIINIREIPLKRHGLNSLFLSVLMEKKP